MIPQEQISKLKEIGIDVDAIVAAHTSDKETAITLPTGAFLSDAQLAERDSVKIKEGESKSLDIAKKEFAKAGLAVTGSRFGDVVKEIQSQINSTNDDKVKALTEQVTLLSTDVNKYKTEAETERANRSLFEFETRIVTNMPKPENGLTQKEVYEVAKLRGYTPKDVDGAIVWEKDGKLISDKTTHAPLKNEAGISEVFSLLGFATPAANNGGKPAGRGIGQGSASESIKTMSEAKKKFAEQNPNENLLGTKFQSYLQEITKADPSFDYVN